MQRTLPLLTGFLFLGFLFSCDSDDSGSPGTINVASNIVITDVANAANASDIEITYNMGPLNGILELRLMLVPSAEVPNFDLTAAESVTAGNYFVINNPPNAFRPDASTTDVNGNAIAEGIAYAAFILSVAESNNVENRLSASSVANTLQQISAVSTLTGFISAGSGGMDVDGDGNIYMADFGPTLNGGGSRVYKITPDGAVSIFANGLNGASGNDFDTDGNLIQSSITGSFISSIAPDGTVSQVTSDGIAGPVGIATQPDGSIFVANCGGGNIQKIESDGSSSLFSDSPILTVGCPNGIDIDDEGNVYIALFSTGVVVKVEPDGTGSNFANIPGNNNGHLLIKDDQIFVIARAANQIYTVDLNTQQVSLFAGTGIRGLRNGPLNEATFSLPNDLAFSPDGSKIYINDVDPLAGAQSNISPVVIRVIDLVE